MACKFFCFVFVMTDLISLILTSWPLYGFLEHHPSALITKIIAELQDISFINSGNGKHYIYKSHIHIIITKINLLMRSNVIQRIICESFQNSILKSKNSQANPIFATLPPFKNQFSKQICKLFSKSLREMLFYLLKL